jgi:hypothetical protein
LDAQLKLKLLIIYSMCQSHLVQFVSGIFHFKKFHNLERLPSSFIETIFFCLKNIQTPLLNLFYNFHRFIMMDESTDHYLKMSCLSIICLHMLFLANFQDLFLIYLLQANNLDKSFVIFIIQKLLNLSRVINF